MELRVKDNQTGRVWGLDDLFPCKRIGLLRGLYLVDWHPELSHPKRSCSISRISNPRMMLPAEAVKARLAEMVSQLTRWHGTGLFFSLWTGLRQAQHGKGKTSYMAAMPSSCMTLCKLGMGTRRWLSVEAGGRRLEGGGGGKPRDVPVSGREELTSRVEVALAPSMRKHGSQQSIDGQGAARQAWTRVYPAAANRVPSERESINGCGVIARAVVHFISRPGFISCIISDNGSIIRPSPRAMQRIFKET